MSRKQLILAKTAIWLVCLAPLGRLVLFAFTGRLTANPVEFIQLSTGTWALIFLLASLAITPLRRLTGRNEVIKFRRLLGLFAFFYASLHFTVYLVLDQNLDLASMWADVFKRPFITVGFTAFVLLLPLALTSTAWSIRKLGGLNWTRLHSLVYMSAIAAVVHFWWKVKADIREPAIYAAILAALLSARLVYWARKRDLAAKPRIAPAEP